MKKITITLTNVELEGSVNEEQLRATVLELVGDALLDAALQGPDLVIKNFRIDVEVEP